MRVAVGQGAGYSRGMSSHSVAEARERLPEPVEPALKGEPVVVPRDGKPAAELRPVAAPRQAGPVTPEALAWLDRVRVQPAKPPSIEAATLLRQMRDEGP